jgi:hypothetical protein
MTAPTVINIRDAPVDWQKDPKFVYIGRFHRSWRYGIIPKSKWHNPFKGSRGMALLMFHDYLASTPELTDNIEQLEGKTLVCWCKPLPCHGDILKELYESRGRGQDP